MAAELAVQIIEVETAASLKSGCAPAGWSMFTRMRCWRLISSLALREALREHRIVERGEEDEQRALAQPKPDEGAELVEVRRDALRLQRVEPVAARVVMRLARFSRGQS